jgi:DNA-binding NarL/FixJ family response regulator
LAEGDETIATDADEVLLHVLAAAGKPAEAIPLGRRLADQIGRRGDEPERRVGVLVAITRAALVAGDLEAAQGAADEARAVAGSEAGRAVLARVDAVAAEVALDRSDLSVAERIGRRAIEGAGATQQPAVMCEALLTLGRVLRISDVGAAQRCFHDAARVAAGADLARWHLRAQQEIVIDDSRVLGVSPLEELRALAARYGAYITVASMDLSRADAALLSFDGEACVVAARACVDASRRFGLASEPLAHLWLAGAYALRGEGVEMHASIDEALARDRDDPRILADLYGRVLTTNAFVRDELDTLREIVDTSIPHMRRASPTASMYPGRAFWTLLCTMFDDDHGDAARAELREVATRYGIPMLSAASDLTEAVALGRAGESGSATAVAASTYAALMREVYGMGTIHCFMLLVAQAAIRGGWGEPASWLRAAEAFFTDRRFDRLARRCRTSLVEAGAPIPRRRGATDVPERLRALGVTGREVDVLKLVVDGCTNKQIAAELVLSPKTVERHMSSLFARFDVHDRQALAALGGPHLREPAN